MRVAHVLPPSRDFSELEDTIEAIENHGGLGPLYDYVQGWREPTFPVPCIPLQVKYDYPGCVNIDNVQNPDDPIIVWMYDSWTGRVV